MTTHYHSQYWAHALTLKSASDSMHNLSRSIANARVDLNPHQVDAALFAFRSPLAKRCTGAEIDRDERKGQKPSNHAPVVATFEAWNKWPT